MCWEFCNFDMGKKNSPNCPEKAKIGGIEHKVTMSKIQNFAEITPNLPFSESNFYELYRAAFENTYFTPEGKVALMFLKMKTQMNSPKLMEELNGNIHY